ncbi:cupredoxin domain-containing protein [Rhodoferax aquaticus]|uniref:Blue (type 1) copper domain-containing protein n=1 Tax=Rhodoferax aquaticus TaxID=2527691 RepID=A0A515ELB2_9BURK|nr:cupredoxin family protein [Rhodoferax aquaticus]QDL53447.1 hypothetical protein EXZ61_04230 [Rhodoferax aquaticus]
MKQNTINFIAACALLTGPNAAFATGSHAGGHGHTAASMGVAGKAQDISRTIHVDMSDAMRFTPSAIQVKQGETIRFVIKNSGQLSHEFVLGSTQDLADHYELMKKNPEMEHADDNMLTVKPGQTGEMLWKFTRSGSVGFACLQVGHFDAGMKGNIAVAAAKAKASKPTSTAP